MVTMYELLVEIAGTPANDDQTIVMYTFAIVLSVYFIFLFMKVFMLIARAIAR